METFLMGSALEEDDGIYLIKQGKYAYARIYYENKLHKVTVKFGENHPECLSVKEKLAFIMYEKGSYLESKELFEEVVRKREDIYGDSHPHCLRIYSVMSLLIKRYGKKSEGDFLYEKLRKILDNMDNRNDDFALSCLQIAISYQNLFKTTEAKRILKELLQKQGNSCWKNLPFPLLIKVELGDALLVTGRYSEAIAHFEDILKVYGDISEKEYFLYHVCRMQIALCYCGMNKFSEANIQFEEILKEQAVRIGNYDADRLNILGLMAESYFHQHKYGEAKSLFEDVLRNEVDIFGKESFFPLETSVWIGKTLIHMRKFSEAKCFLEELSRKISHVCGKDMQLCLHILRLKATLNIERGKYGEAADILEELLVKQLDVVGKYHSEYITSKMMLAEVHSASCKFAESLYIFQDVLRLQSSMFGADHQKCLETKMLIAIIYIKMKKFVKSATLLREVVQSLKEKMGVGHKDTIDAMGLLAVTLFHLGQKEEGAPLLEAYVRKMKVVQSAFEVILCISLSLKEVEEWENLKRVLENGVKSSIEIFGDYHVITLRLQTEFAHCLVMLSKSGESKMLTYKVLDHLSKVNSKDDASCIVIKLGIAFVLRDLCEHEKAITLLREVLETYEKEKIINLDVLFTITVLANSLLKSGKHTEMKLMVKKGLTLLSEFDLKDDPMYVNIAVEFFHLSVVCCYFSKSINLYQELLNLPRNLFGQNHPKYLMVMEGLGVSYMASGEIAKAKGVFLELLKKTEEIHGEEHRETQRIRTQFLMLLTPR